MRRKLAAVILACALAAVCMPAAGFSGNAAGTAYASEASGACAQETDVQETAGTSISGTYGTAQPAEDSAAKEGAVPRASGDGEDGRRGDAESAAAAPSTGQGTEEDAAVPLSAGADGAGFAYIDGRWRWRDGSGAATSETGFFYGEVDGVEGIWYVSNGIKQNGSGALSFGSEYWLLDGGRLMTEYTGLWRCTSTKYYYFTEGVVLRDGSDVGQGIRGHKIPRLPEGREEREMEGTRHDVLRLVHGHDGEKRHDVLLHRAVRGQQGKHAERV